MIQVAVVQGRIAVVDAPEPSLAPGGVLVRTSHSLISAGTEMATVGGGGESLLARALRNPALVRKVLDHAAGHGLKNTVELIRSRTSADQPIGYSCAGVVTEASPGAFRPGDRVACCGAGYASHAQVNFVPSNLAARIPDGVSFEEAAFGTLGAIALQGVRRAAPSLGDRVAVLGLGLLGQLTAQLLRASGAVVIGSDLRPDRVARALELGMEAGFNGAEREFAAGVLERTGGRGADAVIVTAAAGDMGLLNRACDACRRKGRVVLVGDVPIRIQRDRIYKKEIDFLVSTSYGPGRYDPDYEEHGRDYPFAYVRWTEGRNLEEVMRLVAAGALRVRPLIDAVFPAEKAAEAYAELSSERRPTAVLLDFHLDSPRPQAPRVYQAARPALPAPAAGVMRVGAIGFGGYFSGVLLPLLRQHPGFRLHAACARTSLTVRRAVEKEGFARGFTDYRELLGDPEVNVVYVATRHDQHYPIARAALEAGKAVFVEKPMTLTSAEGEALAELAREKGLLLTVGFNRRFSPHARLLKKLLGPLGGPKMMIYRVNAGPLPAGHWLTDPEVGGGRLLGEGVHFFDFLSFLAGAEAVAVSSVPQGEAARDSALVTLRFADGSAGLLAYSGEGNPGAGKERVEVFAGSRTFILDDFRRLEVHGGSERGLETRSVEKGQREQLQNFHRALCGEEELGVTALDGLRATRCAELALSGGGRP